MSASNEIYCDTCYIRCPLSKKDLEILEELRDLEVPEFMDKNYCSTCALSVCWNEMNKLSEEKNYDGWRGWNAGLDMILDKIRCKERCVKRGMMGRSWWKDLGYNWKCSCAFEDLREKEFKTEMEHLRNDK